MHENIVSLYDLSLVLESFIDDSFGGQYFWVTAEISSINVRRGHCYLNLIEKDAGSAFPKAEMRGIIWQNNYERLNSKFSSITGFDLKQDISILFLATVHYSPRYGLSLNITDLRGEFTLGGLMKDKQETINLLVKNGIYDNNKQRDIPLVLQRIAVLSAMDSKGFEDFVNILTTNTLGYRFHMQLFPVMLQGNKAADSIAKQLKIIESRQDDFDVAVLVRGGGGNVDLHCFNAYILAEAIATSSLPILTGIGHTTDYTVADEVAAVHKETPTAVAQYIVNRCAIFEEGINNSIEQLSQQVIRLLDNEETHLEKATDTIFYKPQILIGKENVYFSRINGILASHTMGMLSTSKAGIIATHQNLQSALKRLFQQKNDKLHTDSQYLLAYDPMLLLKRGYSITRKEGKTIQSTEFLSEGDEIETITGDGKIISEVKNIIFHSS